MNKGTLLTLLAILSISLTVSAEQKNCKLVGKVIKVIDGDSITIRGRNKKLHNIRLSGIDAPEKGQPFSKKSRTYLFNLIANKWVCINWNKQDIYHRKVGKVLFNKIDINYKMLNKGLAWHYKKYTKEQTKKDDRLYAETELDAQLATIGIWSKPDYIAPWNWRKGRRARELTTQNRKKVINDKRKTNISTDNSFSCGIKRFCKQMKSCSEAQFYLLQCNLGRLDRDKDGVPCESICGHY